MSLAARPWRDVLDRVLSGQDLSEDDAAASLGLFLDADVPDAVKGALLGGLRAKGETAEEVRGLARAMRAAAVPVALPEGVDALDTCGTGGDGSGSFNLSTAAALVVASLGVPVVKHGNRSVSSKCGSADLLEALGVPFANDGDEARQHLVDRGFAFLFAPRFHAATAAVVPVRRALGVRTVFNLLGPLANPAAPPFQVVGAWSADGARLLAHALAGLPVRRAVVVHGEPGWDEATPCGAFLRLDVADGEVTEAWVDPRDLGLARCAPEALAGGDATENVAILRRVLSGLHGAVRDAVVLNAALALEVSGHARNLQDGMRRAGEALDGGRTTWFVERLVR